MGAASNKRRRPNADPASGSTPARGRPPSSGRGRGRPPNVPRDGRERPPPLPDCFKRRCADVLDRLSKKDHYNIFLEPVNTDEVVGYLETIKSPMDFTTMRNKLERQQYKSLGEFRKDLDLIWSNCLQFNGKEPSNVFSKKAIELRKLTEKLIVTTRQNLEKDKELLQQWREKHRRRKETMAANAAAAAGLPIPVSSSQSTSAPLNNIHPSHQNAARDSLDTIADEFINEDLNGRTPQENALAENLRLQYAGTSGLYKKGALHTPPPQYTKPDGSVVPIPIPRYNPSNEHWAVRDHPVVETSDHKLPDLFCQSLPSPPPPNPCLPRPGSYNLFVDDYASSLYQYVKDCGPISSKIVTELLSPELAVKAQQDQWLQAGYNLDELAKKAAAARTAPPPQPQYRPQHNWTADAIVQLADDIERMNRAAYEDSSLLLPKISRNVTELDGLKGISSIFDEKLLKDVDDVSPQVVDYSMPFGASPASVREVFQLTNFPDLKLSANDVQSLRKILQVTEEFVKTRPPEKVQRSGAAALTPAQLHEMQVKVYQVKRQRRIDAEKQANFIGTVMAHAPAQPSAHHTPQRRRNSEKHSNPGQRVYDRSTVTPEPAPVGMRRADIRRSASSVSGQTHRQQLDNPISLPTASSSVTSRQLAARSSPTSMRASSRTNEEISCSNCGARDSPTWRHLGVNASGAVQQLCLPCALFLEKSGRMRPREVWNRSSTARKQSSNVLPNSHTNSLPSSTSNLLPNVSNTTPNALQSGLGNALPNALSSLPNSLPNSVPNSLPISMSSALSNSLPHALPSAISNSTNNSTPNSFPNALPNGMANTLSSPVSHGRVGSNYVPNARPLQRQVPIVSDASTVARPPIQKKARSSPNTRRSPSASRPNRKALDVQMLSGSPLNPAVQLRQMVQQNGARLQPSLPMSNGSKTQGFSLEPKFSAARNIISPGGLLSDVGSAAKSNQTNNRTAFSGHMRGENSASMPHGRPSLAPSLYGRQTGQPRSIPHVTQAQLVSGGHNMLSSSQGGLSGGAQGNKMNTVFNALQQQQAQQPFLPGAANGQEGSSALGRTAIGNITHQPMMEQNTTHGGNGPMLLNANGSNVPNRVGPGLSGSSGLLNIPKGEDNAAGLGVGFGDETRPGIVVVNGNNRTNNNTMGNVSTGYMSHDVLNSDVMGGVTGAGGVFGNNMGVSGAMGISSGMENSLLFDDADLVSAPPGASGLEF